MTANVQVFGRRDCETIGALLRPATETWQAQIQHTVSGRVASTLARFRPWLATSEPINAPRTTARAPGGVMASAPYSRPGTRSPVVLVVGVCERL